MTTAPLFALPKVPEISVKLRPYQSDVLAQARAYYASRTEPGGRLLIVMPTGAGKCLGIGTPVLMHDGRTLPVESVRPGDLLMGPDSAPRRVLSVTRSSGPLYRIEPVKGEPWVCNDVHVLTLVNSENGRVCDVPLNEYLTWPRSRRALHKLFATGVDFTPSPETGTEIDVSPYFLGVWLGDGRKNLAVGGVAISKPDPEIETAVRAEAERWGLRVRTDGPETGRCPTHHIIGKQKVPNPLRRALAACVDAEWRIDHRYLCGSRETRAALLAGLLDTDGYVHHGGYEIVQKHRGLADSIAFLARSLGLRALISEKPVAGYGVYWRVSISGDCAWLPLRIPRKIATARHQRKNPLRTGFSAVPIGEGEYAGFELDGDGRFLLGDFTVTHNTILFAYMAAQTVANGGSVLVVAHRAELIDQPYKKLTNRPDDPEQPGFGLPAALVGVVMANDRRTRPSAPIQIASIATLVARLRGRSGATAAELGLPPGDLVVQDECHRALAESNQTVLRAYPDAFPVGVTATAYRMDGRGLGEFYDTLLVGATVEHLIAGGWLLRPRVYTHPVKPDVSHVAMKGADYDTQELGDTVNTPTLVGNVVDHWLDLAGGARTIGYAAGLAHARSLHEASAARGIPSAYLDGATAPETRRRIIADLRAGRVLIVWNNDVLTEGTDIPEVDCVVLARHTKSRGLYRQMVGRCMRPHPGLPELARVVVLDHAALALTCGLPDDEDLRPTLDARPRREAGEVAVKECPGCWRNLPAATRVCPDCGWLFGEEREPARAREVDGRLVEVEAKAAKKKGELRANVQAFCDGADAARGWGHGKTNTAVSRHFGKSRTDMTVEELRAVLTWLMDPDGFAREFPVDMGRE